MTRFFGYARTASTTQTNDDYLGKQQEWNKDVADRHNMDVIPIDDVISSGVPIAKRPNGGGMCLALQPGDHVSCHRLDRISRSLIDFMRFREICDKYGVILHVGDLDNGEPCTGNNVSGSTKLILNTLAAVAEMERGFHRERTQHRTSQKRLRAHN